MPGEPLEREIGGKLWTIGLLPTGKGVNIGRRLMKIAGPALTKAFSGGADVDVTVAMVTGLGALIESLGEAETESLVKELVTTGVFCDSKPVTAASYELLFQGDYQTLLGVIAFVIEANYSVPLLSWVAAARNTATLPRKPPASTPAQ